jgi:hypothetical protein
MATHSASQIFRKFFSKKSLFWWILFSVPFFVAFHTWDSADTFMHLNRGQRILESGSFNPTSSMLLQHRDATFYWLFQPLLALLFRGIGIPGLTLLSALLWATVWIILILPFVQTSPRVILGVWILAATLSCCHRFNLRPEILSYILIGIYLNLIMKWDKEGCPTSMPAVISRSIWVILLQFIWAGIHGYFIFGVGFILLLALEKAIGHKKEEAQYLLFLALIGFLASSISPFGFHNWEAVWNHIFLLKNLSQFVSEFSSPFEFNLISQIWVLKIYAVAWVLVLFLALWELTQTKLLSFPWMLSGIGLYLGATSARSMPVFFLFSFPMVAKTSTRLLESRRIPRFVDWFVQVVALVCVGFVMAGSFYRSLGVRQSFGFGLAPLTYSTAMRDYFSRHKFHGLIFNQPEAGGYLAYYSPELHFYGDTLFTDAKDSIEYITASAPQGFRKLDQRFRFDAVLVDILSNLELVNWLLESKDWRVVFSDLYRILLVRKNSLYESELSSEPPRYFEDILTSNEGSTFFPWIVWTQLWVQQADKVQLEMLLENLKKAKAIPTEVLGRIGVFAQNHQAGKLLETVKALTFKRVSFSNEEELRFQNLFLSSGKK